MNFLSNITKFGVVALSAALLSACGDDEDDSQRVVTATPTPTPAVTATPTPTPTPTPVPGAFTGTFDTPVVSTLGYTTTTNLNFRQETSAVGGFSYDDGDTVTFSIGGVTLGSVIGQTNVSLFDIVSSATDITSNELINLARLLLTIDSDSNEANGIQLTEAMLDNAEILTDVNFNVAPAVFEATVDSAASSYLDLISDTVNVNLVSEADAVSYLTELAISMIVGLEPATYNVEIDGVHPTDPTVISFGTLTVEVQPDGTIDGTFTTDDEEIQFVYADVPLAVDAVTGALSAQIIQPGSDPTQMHFEFNLTFDVLTGALGGEWDNNQPAGEFFNTFFASGTITAQPGAIPAPAVQ